MEMSKTCNQLNLKQLLKSLQLHHPVNGGDVGAESGTPGLKAEDPADAYPISHQVQGLHDLLGCRSSLMGSVHVDLDMRDQVSASDARDDDKQFFGFAVYKPLLEVGSLRVVVVSFEGLCTAHSRNEVVQAVPKASERRSPLQFSLQISRHSTPPSLY